MAVPIHTSSHFQFTLSVPLSRAALLFGPEGEGCWAGPHWNPEFLHPQPAKDIPGAVFTIQHGERKAVWVNTIFDLDGGRMQYVAFLPDVFVSTVDVRLRSAAPSGTTVEVTYVRTALSRDANATVEAMRESDRQNGPHWQEAIESCLAQQDYGKR